MFHPVAGLFFVHISLPVKKGRVLRSEREGPAEKKVSTSIVPRALR